MLRRHLLLVLFLAAAVATFARPVAAQQIASPYRYVDESQSASLFGGYIWSNEGDLGLGPHPGPVGGAGYSIRVSGPFTVQGSAAFFSTDRTVLDTTRVDGQHRQLATADIGILLLDAALRFNLTGPRTFYNFMPYLLFGGGAAIEVVDDDEADTAASAGAVFDFGTTFAGEIGAGVEWFMTRRLTLRLDARDVLWQLPNPLAFREQATLAEEVTLSEDEWVQNFVLSLGIAYRF